MASTNPPLSPRKFKGNKPIPRLPLSAFSPPNSGTGEKFPLPPSPSKVYPDAVIDSGAAIGALQDWDANTGEDLKLRVAGVIVALDDVSKASQLSSSPIPVLGVSIPLGQDASSLEGKYAVSYRVAFNSADESLKSTVDAALNKGPVEIEAGGDLTQQSGWEAIEEFLGHLYRDETFEGQITRPVILSNVLPPPGALDVPVVKLISHPSYLAYQTHSANLSFFRNLYIKFTPPAWGTATPASGEERDEWKQRVKMYFGHILEAFGESRVIFGSSPSTSSSTPPSKLADWYELVREIVAELGISAEGVDAIFGETAKSLYKKN